MKLRHRNIYDDDNGSRGSNTISNRDAEKDRNRNRNRKIASESMSVIMVMGVALLLTLGSSSCQTRHGNGNGSGRGRGSGSSHLFVSAQEMDKNHVSLSSSHRSANANTNANTNTNESNGQGVMASASTVLKRVLHRKRNGNMHGTPGMHNHHKSMTASASNVNANANTNDKEEELFLRYLQTNPSTSTSTKAPTPTPGSPTKAPTPSPTPAPFPTAPKPTPDPTSECQNDPNYTYQNSARKTCKWIRNLESRRVFHCNQPGVNEACPQSCGMCCANDKNFKFNDLDGSGRQRGCWYVGQSQERKDAYCLQYLNGRMVRDGCPVACNRCFSAVGPTPSPTPAPAPPTVNTSAPTSEYCQNDYDWFYSNDKPEVTCKWVRNREKRRQKYCGMGDTRSKCPQSCGDCCKNDLQYNFDVDGKPQGE